MIVHIGCEKVLNWVLGPHEDRSVEMVLIWSSFYTIGLIFLHASCSSCMLYLETWEGYSALKWRNMEISTWILFNMYLVENGIIWQCYLYEHSHFCREDVLCCKYTFFDENNDLEVLKSSKIGPHLVLICLEMSFFYHYNARCPEVLKARFRFRTHCILYLNSSHYVCIFANFSNTSFKSKTTCIRIYWLVDT